MATKQSSLLAIDRVDCFAALAMTGSNYKFAISLRSSPRKRGPRAKEKIEESELDSRLRGNERLTVSRFPGSRPAPGRPLGITRSRYFAYSPLYVSRSTFFCTLPMVLR